MVRARVFNEINTALEHCNDIFGVLNLSLSLVKERWAQEFQRMLPTSFCIISFLKRRKSKVF
jgi:hypothetical protein